MPELDESIAAIKALLEDAREQGHDIESDQSVISGAFHGLRNYGHVELRHLTAIVKAADPEWAPGK